jgi:hydroxymethylpyrimidine pyrophosphatase-like HAD family hydrolase
VDVKIYVCGDYENDLEMLRDADVAVCPENAIDSVKDVCDLCLCDHKQGVIADLIEHIEREIREGKC